MSRLRRRLADERGTTLAELMVGLATGTVVMLGLTALVVVTLHTTTKVSARVDATQRARTVLTRLVDQLHSACIAPKAAPMRKESTGTELRFVHAAGSAVSPVPTLSVIALSGTTLTQTDYSWKEGNAPFWVFNTTPVSTTQLMTKVAPIGSKPVFSYYAYGSGALSETPLPTPLSELDASRTIQVGVAFKVGTAKKGFDEEITPARLQDSATFRLTASSYNKEAASLPCQ
jgi:hypothetical protein